MTGPDEQNALHEAREFCRDILPSVSRTFALSIRVLPGSLGGAVQTSYLLCRIADTIEDDLAITAARKAELLTALSACFADPDAAERFGSSAEELRGDPSHVQLVRHTALVFRCYRALPPDSRAAVDRWVNEMIGGMRKFVLAYPTGIRIQSLDEYREYCYYVAGTVGYLLTDLWHQHSQSIGHAQYEILKERSRSFAEALQTVNILKDVATDAARENAVYIPEQLLAAHGGSQSSLIAGDRRSENEAALRELLRLALSDLEQAKDYLLSIPRRALAIRLFCLLPLLFAYATLRQLAEPFVLVQHQLVKISRQEVKVLTWLSVIGVWSNQAVKWLVAFAGGTALADEVAVTSR